jgi:hypothetical protein
LRPVLAFSLFAATLLPVVVLACGGAAPSDLLVSYNPIDTQGSGADGSPPADATMHSGSPDATSTDDSGEDDVAVGPIEAGLVDAAQVEAAAEAGPSGLACTNGTMKVYCQGSDTCCLTTGIGTTTPSCESSSATCLGSPLRCASSADCMMGQVCCSTEQIGFTTTYSVSCASTCTGAGKAELCNPGGGPGGCSNGQTCSASTELPGYSQCL